MALTGTEPASADNLAAALDAGGGASDTGGKPLSVDNLAAALEAKEAAMPATVLYDGPATKSAPLSQSAGDFDYLIVAYQQRAGDRFVTALSSGTKASFGIKCYPSDAAGMFAATDCRVSPNGMTLTFDFNQDSALVVLGMRL